MCRLYVIYLNRIPERLWVLTMPARVRIVKHPAEIKAILQGDNSSLYRDIFRRCTKVQNKAKRNLQNAPKRVDTGRLRSDIHIQMLTIRGYPAGRVGFNVFYGVFVHDGTGIYGPRGRPIRPVRARVLAFKPKGSSKTIYRPEVSGMKPNPFLKNALDAAKD